LLLTVLAVRMLRLYCKQCKSLVGTRCRHWTTSHDCACCRAAVRRFADCMHLAEPGCSVTAAELERHEHYIKFLAEVKVRFTAMKDGVAWLLWHGKGWHGGLIGGRCTSAQALHGTCGLAGSKGRSARMQLIVSQLNLIRCLITVSSEVRALLLSLTRVSPDSAPT
jgi:hypothetical protein